MSENFNCYHNLGATAHCSQCWCDAADNVNTASAEGRLKAEPMNLNTFSGRNQFVTYPVIHAFCSMIEFVYKYMPSLFTKCMNLLLGDKK